VSFEATKNDGSSGTMDVTELAKWSIEKALDGVEIFKGELIVDNDAAPGKVKVTANYDGISSAATTITVFALSKEALANSGSIKEKFGITTEGTSGAVTETFTALHEFIKAGGLTNDKTKDMIVLGDWIDLEAGLEVSPYGVVEQFKVDAANNQLNEEARGEISLQYNDKPLLLRLIVVGINSFRDGGGNIQYQSPENNGIDHVVFQFKNIPGIHIMNQGLENISGGIGYNTGGYAASEMRKYLVPVIEENIELEGSGNFLTGLVNAGVPKDVLWGPTRYVSTVGFQNIATDVTTINDLLWLPTQFEMTGASQTAVNESLTAMLAENDTNQVQLKYYTGGADPASKRTKSNKSGANASYWLGSTGTLKNTGAPYIAGFAMVSNVGAASRAPTYLTDYGVVPAFCVR
jgi:hypothetical protein